MNWEYVLKAANLAAKRTGVRHTVLSHARWASSSRPQEWCWHFFPIGSDSEHQFRSVRVWERR